MKNIELWIILPLAGLFGGYINALFYKGNVKISSLLGFLIGLIVAFVYSVIV